MRISPRATVSLPRTEVATEDLREAGRENLTRAFLSFTQAAGSLENSYTQLQGEVSRLRAELLRTNSELEQSLEENSRVRTFLSRVLANLPCGVVVQDGQGRLQIVNSEARRLLLGNSTKRLTEELHLPAAFQKLIAGQPIEMFSSEQECLLADDSSARALGVVRAAGNQGEPGSDDTIWIVRDITQQKKLAEERELARRSRALAEIATLLAHEIRNPLGSMELFAGLLAEATTHMPETRRWVNHLQAGLRALSATVNNVLQFHSQPAPQMLPTELDRLVAETMEFLSPLARQRGQVISVENQIGKISTHADNSRLKQVFFNISINAFRAMPPGGKLSVLTKWAPQFPGGIVQIDFQDEGRGIPEETLEKIYEPGFTTTPGSPGLGLSVCKKIIEQHGGEIRVSSGAMAGAKFSLFLPISGAAA